MTTVIDTAATTVYPIHDLLAQRWSPRDYDPHRTLTPEQIGSLIEAARWSASSRNEQPWRFIVAARQDKAAFKKLLQVPNEKNQRWSKNAALLVLTVAKMDFSDGRENRSALHDIGLAVQNLTVQATSMGLHLRQMAGIQRDRAVDLYNIPDGYAPVTALAVGYLDGDEAGTPTRQRRPFSEIVFGETWGEPSPLLRDE